MSFSDRLLSVVRPSVCLYSHFTFSSSSPESLSQFRPNLAQSIYRWRGVRFLQMRGPALFKEEIMTNQRQCNDEIKKNHLQNHWANFDQCNFAIYLFSPVEKLMTIIWTNLDPLILRMLCASLVEIGPEVMRKRWNVKNKSTGRPTDGRRTTSIQKSLLELTAWWT